VCSLNVQDRQNCTSRGAVARLQMVPPATATIAAIAKPMASRASVIARGTRYSVDLGISNSASHPSAQKGPTFR
jgi:hypothetical protein